MTEENPNEGWTMSPKAIKNIETGVSVVVRLVGAVGLPGFFTILVFYAIGRYGTADQKIEIIDKYILLKGKYSEVIWILFLAAVVLIQNFHFRRINKQHKKEIDKLRKDNDKYQEVLLKLRKR